MAEYDLFISYRGESGVNGSENVQQVIKLKDTLSRLPFRVKAFTADAGHLNQKSDLPEIVESSSLCFVVVLTKDYYLSPWCVAELAHAVRNKIKVKIIYWNGHEEVSQWYIQEKDFVRKAILGYGDKLKTHPWKLRKEDLEAAADVMTDAIHRPIDLSRLKDDLKEQVLEPIGWKPEDPLYYKTTRIDPWLAAKQKWKELAPGTRAKLLEEITKALGKWGETGVVVIYGSAGVGKSVLLGEVCNRGGLFDGITKHGMTKSRCMSLFQV